MNENENVELEQQIPSNFDESISFEGLDAKYVELQKQLEELTDKYYRANADFENIKKRFEKEKTDIATYANEKFARDLLPVIDALEMAVNFETEGDEYAAKIKEGIYITIDQFKKCFEKNGITAIEANEDFDPNFHNATSRKPRRGKRQDRASDTKRLPHQRQSFAPCDGVDSEVKFERKI